MKTKIVSFTVNRTSNAQRSTSNVQRIAQLRVERWVLSVGRSPVHVHWAVQQGTGLLLLAALTGLLPGSGRSSALAQQPPTYYVDAASANPMPPYTSWATAATNIQQAVNASTVAGRLVLVTNGVYRSGAVVADGTNRVALTNVTLRSVNGPEATVIDGQGQVRCVYLGDGALLSGFTLRHGNADLGGGVYAAVASVVTNCIVTNAIAGGGAYRGTFYDCTLTGNSGGGAADATLFRCLLTGNSAWGRGGGAFNCTLSYCTLSSNRVDWDPTSGDLEGYGGGAYGGSLSNCILTGNSANRGGGVASATLSNCILTGNSANRGGGVAGSTWPWENPCTFSNCTLIGNTALDSGGGAWGATLSDCTVTGNSAGASGGGIAGGTLHNCLVYFNQANQEPNWGTAWFCIGMGGGCFTLVPKLEYSCTFPLAPGPGNISVDPQLASATHLSQTSPCLGAGNSAFASGVDIDGEPWAHPPAIGADQVWPGQSSGPLTVRIEAPFTWFATGYAVSFTAVGTGPTSRSVWDFGDGTVVANQPFIRHAWVVPGTYTVRFTGYNDGFPEGVSTSVEVEVVEAVHYVNLSNLTPVFPYATWETAATNLQDAIDAGGVIGRLVLVTNGVYAVGTASPWTFVVADLADLPSFAEELKHPTREIDKWLAAQLSPATRTALEAYAGQGSDATPLAGALLDDLNRILRGPSIYSDRRFQGVQLRPVTAELVGWSPGEGDELVRLNRLLIEDAYPAEISRNSVGESLGPTRVMLRNAVVVRSVNGPEVTVIEGSQPDPDPEAGVSVRCAYVGSESVLSGFTLTKGEGGVGCGMSGAVTNCTVRDNYGRGASGGTLYNCTLSGNQGGGAASATLYNCTLTGNSAGTGGGAYRCTLYNCTVTGNTAEWYGGGVSGSTLQDCVVEGNSAYLGGGACPAALGGSGVVFPCTLVNCTVARNTAEDSGGGALDATLINCTLTGNTAGYGGGGASGGALYNCTLTGNAAGSGGGAADATLHNCTVIGNSAEWSGGGVGGGTLYNCLVYFNHSPLWANWGLSTFEYSCTFPLPPGPGNSSADPQLASTSHLSVTSPCLGTGNPVYASGLDIDGEPWANPPAIGADQVWPGQSRGPLTVRIEAPFTRFASGFAVSFTGDSTGPILRSVWDFGDGTVVTNQPIIRHAWAAPGTYTVRFTGYSDSHPAGVTTSIEVQVITQAVHYVNLMNPTPAFPFTTWETAATGIQEAVEAGTVIGRLVLVTNGVYRTGTVETNGLNRVALLDPVVVRSLNGPTVTVIEGQRNVRCAHVGNESVLSGFTLTGGAGADGGGGVRCGAFGTVTNCTLTGNYVGGAYGGTLYNCTVRDNTNCGASWCVLRNSAVTGNDGVEVWGCTLYNCTVTGNRGSEGGVAGCDVHNSIVYFNQAPAGGGTNWNSSSFAYSCTSPLPPGPGNIDADPRFVDAGAGDFRLRYGSPCIDAGAVETAGATDLAGLPRPLDGNGDGVARPDLGAYEFDLRTVVPADWFTDNGLDANDPHVLSQNPDQDGQTSFQEWLAGTDPRDRESFFRIEGVEVGPSVTVSYRSLAGRVYTLYAAPSLAGGEGGITLWAPVPGQTAVPGSGGLDTLTDTNAVPRRFYRVGVNLP